MTSSDSADAARGASPSGKDDAGGAGGGRPRPLKIGMACYPTVGGSGAVAVQLAEALAQRGHEVHVISYDMPFRLNIDAGVTFHEVDVPSYPLFKYPPYAMALASKLADVASQHKLDVLHAHYAVPHALAAWLAREICARCSMRVITTLHGTDVTLIGSDPSYRRPTAWAIERSDAVTAVSQFLAQETRRALDTKVPIAVVPNFVDTVALRPSPRSELRRRFAEDDEPLLAHVSNFRPVKRVADVVRTFLRVYRDHPARLVMVGDGPDRPMAERMLRDDEVHHRVTFTGNVPDVAHLLPQVDAFLLPSDGESFGLAALEALSCGVPVVGAKAGGLPEVVRDGIDGILEPVAHCEEMGERLSALLSQPAAMAAARLEARAGVEERFRPDTIVPLYERLYRAEG